MEEGKNISQSLQESAAAYSIIHEKFGSAISDFDANETMPFFEVVDTSLWTEIALFMREHPKLQFNYMACLTGCLLYTSPSPRDGLLSRMPSSA